jgi:hypothetical protein
MDDDHIPSIDDVGLIKYMFLNIKNAPSQIGWSISVLLYIV